MADRAPAMTEADRRAQRRHRREVKEARAAGVLEGLCAALGPQSLCIDCGAHYGTVTSRLAATGAAVHSFEPDPHSWQVLTETCGHLPNVTLHNAAVATQAGTLTLYRNADFGKNRDRGSTGSTIMAENRDALPDTAHQVQAVDLPAFLRAQIEKAGRITFLKLDIEGAEVDILETLVRTDILTRINLTVVETHGWLFPQWKDRYAALKQIAAERPEFNLNLGWI